MAESNKIKYLNFKTLVDPSEYWSLSMILLAIGFCFISYFAMYE